MNKKIDPAPSSGLADKNICFMVQTGLLKTTADDLEALSVWGRIIHDPILVKRATAKHNAIAHIPTELAEAAERDEYSDEYFDACLTRLRAMEAILPQVCAELTRSERTQLRERLTGVSAMPARS